MTLNVGKMKKYRQEKSGAGNSWVPDEGDTILYLAPPQTGMDEDELTEGFNFLDVGVHYGLGPTGKQVAGCLNMAKNHILKHPALKTALEEAGVDISGGCPVCEALDGTRDEPGLWQTDKDYAMDIRFQSRYIWKIIAIGHRKDSGGDYRAAQPDKMMPYECGKTVWEGMLAIIEDHGDITDPTGAKLIKLTRKGKDITTKYNLSLDKDFTPTKPQFALIKKSQDWEHESNLFGYAANNLFTDRTSVEALLAGVVTEEVEVESTSEHKECFGLMYEAGSEECEQCGEKSGCKIKCEGSTGAASESKPTTAAAPQRKKSNTPSTPETSAEDDPEIAALEQQLKDSQKK